MRTQQNPFKLPIKPRWLASLIEKALSLSTLATIYEERPKAPNNALAFLQHAIAKLDFSFTIENPDALEALPATGPLIIVANHPLGGLEGIAMSAQLVKLRPDLKVLTNELLATIPELSDLFIGVDVLTDNAAQNNTRGIRTACKHLSAGGALLIYPAGKVSEMQAGSDEITDRSWSTLVGSLAKRYQAHCLPCYVHGRNSKLFYWAGFIHRRLRTALLARELVNKKGQEFTMRVGELIAPSDYQHIDNKQTLTDYLRVTTDLLSIKKTLVEAPSQSHFAPLNLVTHLPSRQQAIATQLDALEDCLLVKKRNFSVYCAPYQRLGLIMEDIALAREVTFRAAGEGTGKHLDSDQFDPHYLHLFVWDHKANCLVGGYRLANAQDIVAKHGLDALYSHSLYHFNEHYLERLGGSLEMGRSFVVPEYQRHPRALDLLWQGIGRYVAKYPQYHTLFGCVSISHEHSELAQAFISDSMISAFRAEQYYLNDIKPRTPLKIKGKVWSTKVLASLSNITIINKLVGQCQPGKVVPIILRHYLALNGRFVCFSVNNNFNQSLDGLIIVDLRKTPEKYLNRYLGQSGKQRFLAKWREHETAA